MDRLDRFLAAAERRPFVDGEHDCCLMAADWVMAATGRDPAAGWRGRYRTARGAARIVAAHGGLTGIMSAGATNAGLRQTTAPKRGDVGAVILPGGEEVAAILTGRLWVRPAFAGLAASPATPIRTWRVLDATGH